MGVFARITARKMRVHVPQLLGLVLLLAVGVCFFITLFTIMLRYEETAEQYMNDYAYADVTFYGIFDDESVRVLSETDGVYAARGRSVRDFRVPEDERIFRAVSLMDGINLPYFYQGRPPENAGECILLKRNADAMKLGIGDTVAFGENELVITGLAANPEYIYMVQNERTMMAQQNRFGVVYVVPEFFAQPGGFDYNEIVVLLESETDVNALAGLIGAFRAIMQKDQINYEMYRNDLSELGSFAYIFPLVFAVLIAVVIYVMLTRAVQKDRRQIGVMKALGAPNKKIIAVYLLQFCITAVMGALLGCFAAMAATGGIIAILSSMFVVPSLGFALYPVLWVLAVVVSVLLCAAAGLIALVRILPLMPACALRPRTPKGGRRLLIERIGSVWVRFSFNTRYALKNSLRNKSRFLAVVLGMTGSCALLAFSLGFHDSIAETQGRFFDDFANYDVIVSFNPMPPELEHAAETQACESSRALILHVEIGGEHYPLAIVEDGFDFVKIPYTELNSGVIIPEYFAGIWDAGIGDTLEINGYEAVVSAVVPQHVGLTLYTSFEYMGTVTDEIPPVYNTLYLRSADMPALVDYLNVNGMEFTTIDDDKTSFDSIMESMEVLIWFMIACSLILGFTVLYAVGLINLSAREYEYMFMGVMGYPHKSIIAAHIKETLVQLALALPLGFSGGFLLLEAIKGEFSNNNFVIASIITPASNFYAATAVAGVTVIMAAVTSRHVRRLDIVEGLKAQDDG
ncbi:MAG: FtsX-like permease family protein [Oscillospiraceae bacterium]|nr:FtsX-like permease family protein [Oscillospiraceae bacterium]